MRTIIKIKKLSVVEGFLILAISFAAYAQDNWIPFGAEGIPQKAEPQVVRCDAQSIRIDVKIPGMLSRRLSTKGGEFTRLTLIDYGYTTEIGKPQLPVIRELVEIPHGANFSVDVISASYQEVDLAEIGIDTKIIPVQPPIPKISNAKVTFEIDKVFYQKDSYYLTDIVKINEIGKMRGYRLAQIEIFPVNYNPKAGNGKLKTLF